jgi:beta-glucanase (GH16 family)
MLKNSLFLVFFITILRGSFAQNPNMIIPYPTPENPIEKAGWQLVFQDEFEGDTLKGHWWPQETTRPDEKAAFTNRKENIALDSGRLNIIVRRENYKNYKYTGGIMFSSKAFVPTIYAEVMCRFPKGPGFWPSFWMWTGVDSTYQEIDIVEYYGKKPNSYEASHHFWDDSLKRKNTHYRKVEPAFNNNKISDLSAEFHIYAVEWTQEYIKYYMDNLLVFETTSHIPFRPMSVILGMGLGRDRNKKKQFPGKFEIEYVRVYEKLKN